MDDEQEPVGLAGFLAILAVIVAFVGAVGVGAIWLAVRLA